MGTNETFTILLDQFLTGFDASHNSWEPLENVSNTKELIQQFDNRYCTAIKPPITKLQLAITHEDMRPWEGGNACSATYFLPNYHCDSY